MKIVLKVIEKRLAMSSWSSSRLLSIQFNFQWLFLFLLQLKSWNELNRLNRIKIIACSISLITIHSAEDVWMFRYVLLRFISFIRRLHILCWKPSTPRSSAVCSFQAPIQHRTVSSSHKNLHYQSLEQRIKMINEVLCGEWQAKIEVE